MRRHLVWVLGLALAIGIANVAVGANFQTIDGTFKPNTKLSKTKFKGGSVNVVTTTGTNDGSRVAPAVRAQVWFDDDMSFFTRGVARCNASRLTQTTTAQAKARCGAAQVGAGSATIALAGNPDPAAATGAVVTAFNGVPKNGKPVILLHARAETFGNTSILTGVLNKLGRRGDYGWRLDVKIDELPFGSAITRFQVKVKKQFRFRGKRRNYVSGRCGDRNRKLNYKGKFYFNGDSPKSDTDAQACTRR
jgi:hypothetical protein